MIELTDNADDTKELVPLNTGVDILIRDYSIFIFHSDPDRHLSLYGDVSTQVLKNWNAIVEFHVNGNEANNDCAMLGPDDIGLEKLRFKVDLYCSLERIDQILSVVQGCISCRKAKIELSLSLRQLAATGLQAKANYEEWIDQPFLVNEWSLLVLSDQDIFFR